MRNKFLGFICLLYSILITYNWYFDKLKNYLAPQMQMYIKISFFPLIIISLVLLINRSNNKFRINDLVLILPLIMLIISNDGILNASLAANRMNNTQQKRIKEEPKKNIEEEKKDVEEAKKDVEEEKKEEVEIKEPEEKYDFTNPYFDVKDTFYSELANYITYVPEANKFVGKTIKLKGFTIKYGSYLPDGYFAFGRYLISCCAADAEFVGFYAKYDMDKLRHNHWYEIEGVLEQGKDNDGIDIVYIKVINIKELEKQNDEQYIYPCYAYDNGLCKAVDELNLDFE